MRDSKKIDIMVDQLTDLQQKCAQINELLVKVDRLTTSYNRLKKYVIAQCTTPFQTKEAFANSCVNSGFLNEWHTKKLEPGNVVVTVIKYPTRKLFRRFLINQTSDKLFTATEMNDGSSILPAKTMDELAINLAEEYCWATISISATFDTVADFWNNRKGT